MTNFESKIIKFLADHYKQQMTKGNQSVTETKRLTKSKTDIAVKIKNSMDGFVLLSEIIRISNITPEKVSSSNLKEKYIRQKYSNLAEHIIDATRGINLVGEPLALEYFKNLQRTITSDVFELDKMERLLDAIFGFHPAGIIPKDTSKRIMYENAPDLDSVQYKEEHRKYYRDMVSMLVEYGIKEIKKNRHPEKDKPLIDNLNLTVNTIRKLDYHVEKIDIPKTDI